MFGERENEKQGRFSRTTPPPVPGQLLFSGTKRAEISRHTPAISRARREIEMVSREHREGRGAEFE